MNVAMPADRSTDARGCLPGLGYFVLGSLLLHALVLALWQGKPPAGPVGKSTFQITLLARHGDTSGKAGVKDGQQESNAIKQSSKSGESSSGHSARHEPEDARPLPVKVLAASSQSAAPAASEVPQSRAGPRGAVKKTRGKAPEEAKAQLTGRHSAAARGDISATPGSASTGQDPLNSAARYRRVRAALHEALLPRFDYPSAARRRGWQGRVRIGLHVEADGDLTRIHLVESSGHALLDRAAVKNVTELRNVPAAAQWLDGLDMDMILPVRYRLRDR
jgi:protein TonB